MIKKIGHRGAMGYAPENTLRSFAKAIELHVDMVELDVHRCRSGEVVVIHDDSVDRTTNGTGLVKEKTLEELEALDAGGGERVPTLAEVFDFAEGRVQINIELKGAGTAGPVSEMIDTYVRDTSWEHDDFLISSFSRTELTVFRGCNLYVPVGVLLADIAADMNPVLYAFAREIKAVSVHPPYRRVNKSIIAEFHEHGFLVYVWTVNKPDAIARMKQACVDGIISNYPDYF